MVIQPPTAFKVSKMALDQKLVVKGMSDERQSRPTFVGVVELPTKSADKIGEP